jgi:translation initiation factor IF-3
MAGLTLWPRRTMSALCAAGVHECKRRCPRWVTAVCADSVWVRAILLPGGSGLHDDFFRGVGIIQDNTKRVRVNRQIRISPLRVIAADGSQLGIMDVEAALAAAVEQGLDLVEVAPTARPPVVRIMDYGKFKFEQAKMARQAKKKQHIIHLKEVKYRPGIEDHDFDTKTRHAREFLLEGNKVKVTMMFRGRQIAHPELGKEVVDRVAATLADVAKIESDAKLEGKSMIMILTPR